MDERTRISDQGENGSDSDGFKLWIWMPVWSIWGLVLCLSITILDSDPLSGAAFGIAGVLIGLYGLKVVEKFALSYFGWHRDWFQPPDPDLVRFRRIMELTRSGETNSPEYLEWLDEESFEGNLSSPPLLGLIHGILIGGICGALCRLESTFNILASQGALLGLFIGTVVFSFLASITFACLVKISPKKSFKTRIARRMLITIAPLLIFPVAWRGLNKSFHNTPHRKNGDSLPPIL